MFTCTRRDSLAPGKQRAFSAARLEAKARKSQKLVMNFGGVRVEVADTRRDQLERGQKQQNAIKAPARGQWDVSLWLTGKAGQWAGNRQAEILTAFKLEEQVIDSDR